MGEQVPPRLRSTREAVDATQAAIKDKISLNLIVRTRTTRARSHMPCYRYIIFMIKNTPYSLYSFYLLFVKIR